LLVVLCPTVGAVLGVFLGVYLVHGWPAQGELGWAAVAACTPLALVGLMAPTLLLRAAGAACPRCGGRATLRTGLRPPLGHSHGTLTDAPPAA
jgi:hypothetical protein